MKDNRGDKFHQEQVSLAIYNLLAYKCSITFSSNC